MFGKEMIDFIQRNKLEDAKILDGKDDLPGYITSAELAEDMHVKHKTVMKWIQWGIIPDCLHIGKLWYVPCDLILVSEADWKELQPAPDEAKEGDTV